MVQQKWGRVAFGHQSVGNDLIAGVTQLAGDEILVVHGRTPPETPGGVILHTKIGTNGDPLGKIRDFGRWLEELDHWPTMALMKLCYADIGNECSVESLFSEYSKEASTWIKRYPNTRILHCTVPLVRTRTGWSAKLREWLGRGEKRIADNAARHRFNTLLLRSFPRETIYNLALEESSDQSGHLHQATWHGIHVPSLNPEYTDDGGHLNTRGRRQIGSSFIKFIKDSATVHTGRPYGNTQ